MKIHAISANEIESFTNAFDADESSAYFKRDLSKNGTHIKPGPNGVSSPSGRDASSAAWSTKRPLARTTPP
jgi:hypothetical protein